MRIIVDAFGGDNAPLEIIKGSLEAKSELGVDIVLSGNKIKIEECAKKNNIDISTLEILDAQSEITMHDDPTAVIKDKSNSSMAVGLKALREGKADAFASAGNSGALTVGASTIVKRIKGVKRVTFSAIMPRDNGIFLMSDVGANVDCRPEMLEQFAVMSDVYMKNVMNIENPRTCLLNVGTESHKGRDLERETYNLLKENKTINFCGNIEPRDIVHDTCDVVIADGYTGNIALKTYEGVALMMMSKMKGVFYKNLLTKLSALMVKGSLTQMKKELDYNEHGGAPIIGAQKPVFKIHGSAKAKTVKNALRLTKKYVESNVIRKIEDRIIGG